METSAVPTNAAQVCSFCLLDLSNLSLEQLQIYFSLCVPTVTSFFFSPESSAHTLYACKLVSGTLFGVASCENKLRITRWCENHHLPHCSRYLSNWKLNHWQLFAYSLRFVSNKAATSKNLHFKSSKEDNLYSFCIIQLISFFSYFNAINCKVFIGTRSCKLKIEHKSILIQIVQMKQEPIQGSACDCFCSINS